MLSQKWPQSTFSLFEIGDPQDLLRYLEDLCTLSIDSDYLKKKLPELLIFSAQVMDKENYGFQEAAAIVEGFLNICGHIELSDERNAALDQLKYARSLSFLYEYLNDGIRSKCIDHARIALTSLGNISGSIVEEIIGILLDIAINTGDHYIIERLNYHLTYMISKIQFIYGQLIYLIGAGSGENAPYRNVLYESLVTFYVFDRIADGLGNENFRTAANEIFSTTIFHLGLSQICERFLAEIKKKQGFQLLFTQELRIFMVINDHYKPEISVSPLDAFFRFFDSRYAIGIRTDIHLNFFCNLLVATHCYELFTLTGSREALAESRTALGKVRLDMLDAEGILSDITESFWLQSTVAKISLECRTLQQERPKRKNRICFGDYPTLSLSYHELMMRIFENSFPKLFLVLCHSYPVYVKWIMSQVFDTSCTKVGLLRKLLMSCKELEPLMSSSLTGSLKFDLARQNLILRCYRMNFERSTAGNLYNQPPIYKNTGLVILAPEIELSKLRWHQATRIWTFTTSFIEITDDQSLVALKYDFESGKVSECVINEFDNLILKAFRRAGDVTDVIGHIINQLEFDLSDRQKVERLIIERIRVFKKREILIGHG